MSLASLTGQPAGLGGINRIGLPGAIGLGSILLDAANEAAIFYGQIVTEDGASHTIDTTGSSAFKWRAGAVTNANAGTTLKIGLAGFATGTPARAANTANVIDFDVAAVRSGSGVITANASLSHAPTTGTKTVANGDWVAFAIQMTARGGVDVVNVQAAAVTGTVSSPGVTEYLGGSYASSTRLPDVLITFSDGTRGWFLGGYVSTTNATTTWNNTSGTKEYGNIVQFPFPVRIYGIEYGAFGLGGAADLILYSDPLGTPVAERTASMSVDRVTTTAAAAGRSMFSSYYDLPANTPGAVIVKPTSATNVTMIYNSLDAAADQDVWGSNGYAVNRNAGAFAAQNSNKDRYSIGALVAGFDAGGVTGISRARAAAGF